MNKIFTVLSFFAVFQISGISQPPGWGVIPLSTTANLNSIHYLDPFNLYIGGDVLLNVTSPDSGSTWQVTTYQPPVTLNDIVFIDDSTIVTVGNSGTILRSTDGGVNWTVVSSGVADNLLTVSFIDSLGICGGLSQTILYTSDGGESWTIAQSGFFGGGFWGAIMLSPQIGFVAGENSIFQPLLGNTINSGHNWNFAPFYLDGNEGRATGVDFTDQFIGYVSARVWDGRGAIAKTTDTGGNWSTTFFDNPLWSIDFPISNASLIGYSAGDLGIILKTEDAGNSWQPQQSGTTAKLNKIYFIDLDTGYAVGENGTLLRTTTGGEPITSLRNNDIPSDAFTLYQNYPNPFNPATSIQFELPLKSQVTLNIFGIAGQNIATLINEEWFSAGMHEVTFNADQLPSGVYLYRLSVKSFTQTRKMILLK